MAANDYQVAGDHYKTMGVEPWDVVDSWPIEQAIGAYRAGALKYIMRMGSKDEQLQEIRKARHYLDKLIECLSNYSASSSHNPPGYYPPRNMKETFEEAYK